VTTEVQIGVIAKRAGVSVDTLRYYERLRLLPRARRSRGGFRLFDRRLIEHVMFIKQAQGLGFSLQEIKGLLTAGGAKECRCVRDLLKKKIEELDIKVKAMKQFRRTLTVHLLACERELMMHGQNAYCPIVIRSKLRAYEK